MREDMNEVDRIKELISTLNHHTELYDAGNPVISDQEWDKMYFELVSLEEKTGIVFVDSPTNKIHYEVVSSLKKVNHNHSMLSLEKTKDVSDIISFAKNKPVLCMFKLDGLTCSLRYVNGELVSAETRGNGLIGEDILHNAKVITSIPKKIAYKDELIVDGEVLCTKSDFETFSLEYKNPRNFASGSIRLLDAKECSKRNLTFVVWEVISGFNDEDSLNERLRKAEQLGFLCVPRWTGIVPNEDFVTSAGNSAKESDYPTDGLVFKFDSISYGRNLGSTSHHFRNAMAFKFYDEVYLTALKDIEWTMGRTGVLTPVAVFDAIDIDGSTVERASLHNLSVMKELLGVPYVGQKIEVFKANMIIPQIKTAERAYKAEEGSNIIPPFPRIRPICGQSTGIVESDSGTVNVVCESPSCEGKLINRLDHFCGKKGLDIKGLSQATLEQLIDWGWVSSITDLYSLSNYQDEWVKKPGFGAKSVSNILTAIENSKNSELSAFISALGIPLIGSTYAKTLAKKEPDWFNIREDIEGRFDFTLWDGFGSEMCSALWKFNYTEADYLVDHILNLTNSLWKDPNQETTPTEQSLSGVTVVITGKLNLFKNRAELQAAIESQGGKVTGSVTKNTHYLVNNDNNSTSAKNMSAIKLGIPVVTEQEFFDKFLKNS